MRTIRCLILGCVYDAKEDCKRCGRENPRLTRARENFKDG